MVIARLSVCDQGTIVKIEAYACQPRSFERDVPKFQIDTNYVFANCSTF